MGTVKEDPQQHPSADTAAGNASLFLKLSFLKKQKKVPICLSGLKLVWLVDGPTASLRKQNIAEPDEAAGVC